MLVCSSLEIFVYNRSNPQLVCVAGRSHGAAERSGPSASSAAAAEALETLTAVLCLTMPDDYVISVMGPASPRDDRIEDPLAALRQLASPAASESSPSDTHSHGELRPQGSSDIRS